MDNKYYLSETVKDYVLSSGTKNYKAAPGTDPEIARTLLQSMHKCIEQVLIIMLLTIKEELEN